MTHPLLLPIGDFAVATSLPPQTLRYYHSKRILVPAEVDEETGYRAYAFHQVNQALLIVALRGAGVRIRDIRAVLGAPDLLPGLITEHRAFLQDQRTREDAALAQATQLAAGWPTAEDRDRVAATVVVRRVPGEAVGADGAVLPERVRAAADALQRDVADAGIETTGRAWCRYALETSEDRSKVTTRKGADWMVAIDLRSPGDGSLPLPANTEIRDVPHQRERIVRLSATPTMVALAAALDYLTGISVEENLIPDLAHPRYILHEDHVEIAVAVEAPSKGE